jgi:hypothetical protein
MTFSQRKLFGLAAWAMTVVAIGSILAHDKPNLWVFITSLALIPVMVGNWLWTGPEATLSQLIVTARSRS